jgi:hypothetical protein
MPVAIRRNKATSPDAPIDSIEAVNTSEGARAGLAVKRQHQEETEFHKRLDISDEAFAINDQTAI